MTFFTTTLAGVQWLTKNPFELANFPAGITYAALLIFMLSSHEFGHYFAARRHGVDSTLPFFLPFPSVFGLFPFGTLGAVIRLRSPIPSRKVLFDIGAAGPIAGFIVSLVILVIGFTTLPSKEYLYTIHPEYAQMDQLPTGGLSFGATPLYWLLSRTLAPDNAFVPAMNEMYHYPFLCVGWFGLFVTAMNLIPVGQLDGGHISYALFGRRYHTIAQVALTALVVMGLSGLLPLVGVEFHYGWPGWLFWALMLIVFIRGFRMQRPPIEDETPLDPVRAFLGWVCVVIFVSCFSLAPFTLEIS